MTVFACENCGHTIPVGLDPPEDCPECGWPLTRNDELEDDE
jgi:rubrerythrin